MRRGLKEARSKAATRRTENRIGGNPGIPTVLDRFVQQAVLQVLQRRWDRTFSRHSYGFRPGRSAHQAVAQAQRYIAEGHRWVVDIDLEKFFDRVPQGGPLSPLLSNLVLDDLDRELGRRGHGFVRYATVPSAETTGRG